MIYCKVYEINYSAKIGKHQLLMCELRVLYGTQLYVQLVAVTIGARQLKAVFS